VDIDEKNPDVYAFLRRTGDETVLVALNMSAKPKVVNLDWSRHGIHPSGLDSLYASQPTRLDDVKAVELAPYAAMVVEVK
jgi:glycosidase